LLLFIGNVLYYTLFWENVNTFFKNFSLFFSSLLNNQIYQL